MRVREIAQQEKVHITTVRNWIRDGALKASTDEVGYIISSEDWEAFKKKYTRIVYTANPKTK
jgi:predicted site-specific integrase-resolvase